MNCREFLTEFEERADLTHAATLHLNDCADCKKTSAAQTRVWQMIDGMKRVDAPTDFEFRVKARIANAKPTEFQPRFLPTLRYVLPLSLVVLILSLVVFNTAYFSGDGATPTIVENISQSPVAAEIPARSNSVSPEQTPAINNFTQSFTNETVYADNSDKNIKPKVNELNEVQFVAYRSRKVSVKTPANPKTNDINEGGSRDLSSKPPPPAILPAGIDTNQSIETVPKAGNAKSADEHLLSFIGIETTSESGSKKVKAVTSGSAAERAGVKVGDVIEAVDGKQVGGSGRSESFEGKKLTVRRGSEKIEIDLQNKSN